MKRWQRKNEKLMVGGLFLVLVATSAPWLNTNALEVGTADLAATNKPSNNSSDARVVIHAQVAEDISANETAATERTTSETSNAVVATEVANNDDQPIHAEIRVGNRILEATYESDDRDRNKTIVTLSQNGETEGQACNECQAYRVTHPLNGGNLDNIKIINQALQARIKEDQKVKRENPPVQARRRDERPTRNSEVDDREPRREQPQSRPREMERRYEDPIVKQCGNKRSQDVFTLCAMKELGRLANIKGDDAFDAAELQELFDEHIARNLRKQLTASQNPGRRDDAKIATANLIEKLDESNSEGIRIALTKLLQLPTIVDAQEIVNLYREAKLSEKTNPSRSLRLMQEFNTRRLLYQQRLNEDINDTALAYENLVDDEAFTRDRAMSQLYDSYIDPLLPYRDALWSNDPSTAMNGLMNPLNQVDGTSMRGARSQGGANFFPPLGQQGQMNNGGRGYNGVNPRGGNNSGFPPSGGGFNSRFNGQQNNGPMQGRFAPGTNYGPGGNFNAMGGPVRPINGGVGPMGNMGFNGGYNYNPGFMGGMGMGGMGMGMGMGMGGGIRPPMFGGGFGNGFGMGVGPNYGGGFCNGMGMGMYNPVGGGCGYGPVGGGIAALPIGGGPRPPYYGGGFGVGFGMGGGFGMGMQPMGPGMFPGGPGMMPWGGPGMGATRPRF